MKRSTVTHRRMTEHGKKHLRVSRYYPGLSVNGKLVHLACGRDGDPLCRADIDARYKVQGRITCPQCLKRVKGRELAKRHAHKPLVVGLDWEPSYRNIRDALDLGLNYLPKFKGPSYLPVFA